MAAGPSAPILPPMNGAAPSTTAPEALKKPPGDPPAQTRDGRQAQRPDPQGGAGQPGTKSGSTGRARVVIENVSPDVDCGRFPAKSSVGESVRVECDAFVDGHDHVSVILRHRVLESGGASGGAGGAGNLGEWREVEMKPLVNDRWAGGFDGPRRRVARVHRRGVGGPVRHLAARPAEARRGRTERGGRSADRRRPGRGGRRRQRRRGRPVARRLCGFAAVRLPRRGDRGGAGQQPGHADAPPRPAPVRRPSGGRRCAVWVDRAKARFSTWYELFPRSASPEPDRHGHAARRRGPARGDRRRWASTCCTCRRSTRSAGRSARGGTTPPPPSPATSAAPGPSAAPKAGTTPSTRSSATFEDFDRLVRCGRRRAASRSRWTWRSSARPITPTCASTPSGSATAPTAPSSTPRTRPRSTRTSTPSTSSARTGRRCGTSCSGSSCSGTAAACACSAWTTRTPSRSRSGSG